ncbi:MAG: RNA polymerase sigma factor [Acidimicrobiales bacterium]
MKFTHHRARRRRRTTSSFEQVIQAAKGGDDGAVSDLYLNHVAIVYGYLRTCGLTEAEDATSEVFIGMIRGLARFNGDELDFRRWLMTIAHRRMVDQRRRLGRNRTELSDVATLESMGNGRATPDLRALELDSTLVEAFGRLTEAQREVLALRFVADMSLQGVAVVTGRPTTAVKSLQNRGLESLRKHMSVSKAQLNA